MKGTLIGHYNDRNYVKKENHHILKIFKLMVKYAIFNIPNSLSFFKNKFNRITLKPKQYYFGNIFFFL